MQVNLQYNSDLSYWIGRVLGLPQSTTSGDVLAGPSKGYLFTANDLASIQNTYHVSNGVLITQPIFEAKYANATGYEIIVGWENLRARQRPGPTYVSSVTTVAAILGAGTPSPTGPAVFPIYTYRKGGSGTYYYPKWPFMATNYSAFGGLTGTDLAPATLGQGSYTEPYATLLSLGMDDSPKLFAFDPSLYCIPFNTSLFVRGAPPKYRKYVTVPLSFYKDPATSTYRISTRRLMASSGARVGGYAFAIE